MKKQILFKWTAEPTATYYILVLTNLSIEDTIEIPLGNVTEYSLEFDLPAEMEAKVLACNETTIGEPSLVRQFSIKEPLQEVGKVVILNPVEGQIFELEEESQAGGLPIPIGKVNVFPQPGSQFVGVGNDNMKQLKWQNTTDKSVNAYKLSVIENGTLIIDDQILPAAPNGILTPWVSIPLKYDSTYQWMIKNVNDVGDSMDNVWFDFTSEYEIKKPAPIAILETIETELEEIEVHLVVKNFAGVGTNDLAIYHDREIAECTKVEIADGVPNWGFAANPNPVYVDLITSGFVSGMRYGLTLPDDTVYIKYTFKKLKAGTTPLEFAMDTQYRCEWYDENFISMDDFDSEVHYVNGSLTFI